LAIAATALLLVLWGTAETQGQTSPAPPAESATDNGPADLSEGPTDPGAAVEEATDTISELAQAFWAILPKIVLALGLMVLAWLVAWALRLVLRRTLSSWHRWEALGAMLTVAVWVLAFAAALSIIAGDPRAMVGLVGLAGLALSWALQAPIESFTGWILNTFKAYYQVGDRVSVGEVFGDVYRIDLLTTTVWEAGGPEHAVQGAQPTGSLITFPNSEVLRSNIVNYTKLFPYVWHEIVVGVGDGTDLRYAASVCEGVARRVVTATMDQPIQEYRRMLDAARLTFDIADEPTVFVTLGESWNNLVIRYLVHARQRRRRSSDLSLAIASELARPEHRGRIVPHLRARIELTGPAAERAEDADGDQNAAG
jgi:small-conductance mechanosensitive channel